MRNFRLVNASNDEWSFFASSEQLKHKFVGGNIEMADGSVRKWIRTTKRSWELSVDVLERSDKWLLLKFAEEVTDLKFYTDDLEVGEDYATVQVDITSTLDFSRLKSNEILYNVSFVLREV